MNEQQMFELVAQFSSPDLTSEKRGELLGEVVKAYEHGEFDMDTAERVFGIPRDEILESFGVLERLSSTIALSEDMDHKLSEARVKSAQLQARSDQLQAAIRDEENDEFGEPG